MKNFKCHPILFAYYMNTVQLMGFFIEENKKSFVRSK